MKNSDRLLALYREYETIMRDKGIDCKEYEDKANDLTGARLRMCRLHRNYLSHQNDPGFLDISDSQIKFMETQVENLKCEEDVVKKHIKSAATAACTDKDKCWDVLPRFNKLKVPDIVVVTDDGFKIASIFDVITQAMVSKTSKMSSLKYKKQHIVYVEPTRKMCDVPACGVVICTSDGTSTGKLLGILYN